jgi:hypothetical protein
MRQALYHLTHIPSNPFSVGEFCMLLDKDVLTPLDSLTWNPRIYSSRKDWGEGREKRSDEKPQGEIN